MALYTRIKGPVGYTTIGSPTMTDGIATGFSSSNYYKLDTPFLPGNNAWQIVIRAKFNNLTARHTLISFAAANTRSVQLTTTVNRTLVTYLSSNGTSANIAQAKESTLTIEANTWYYFRIRFTRTAYEISVSEDRQVWTTYITVNSSTPVWQGTYFSIGYNFSQYPEPMDGYIDFNNSYIQIEDTAFWGYSVSRAKIRTNPFVKYTVVGSPTITDGVASGFSENDYLQTNVMATETDITKYEFFTKFKVNSLGSGTTRFALAYRAGSREGICVDSNDKLSWLISRQSGTKTDRRVNSSITVAINTEYTVWCHYLGNNVFALDVSTDNGTTWTRNTSTINVTILREMSTSQLITVGGAQLFSSGYKSPFFGSIDLNNTYIKDNGQYWFNGAMQNVETWTPHIKDN